MGRSKKTFTEKIGDAVESVVDAVDHVIHPNGADTSAGDDEKFDKFNVDPTAENAVKQNSGDNSESQDDLQSHSKFEKFK